MLLEPLVSVLAEVKERLQRHNQELRQSEALTRSALIDPVLRALGWNTEDPNLARPEYSVSSGKADYALLSPGGKVTAFIEAKSLGQSLEQDRDIDQLLRYAFTDGIPYGVLTNGSHWHAYDLKIPGVAMKERRILETSVADAEPYQCALQLLYLWRPNLASGQPVPANVPPMPAAATPIAPPPNPALAQPQPAPVSIPPASASWTPLSQINPGTYASPPKAMRFPGRDPQTINNWRSIMVESVEYLVNNGTLTAQQLPIRGLGFIHSEPKNAGYYHSTPGGVYVNLSMSAARIVRRTRNLLNHFHINPETVELSFE